MLAIAEWVFVDFWGSAQGSGVVTLGSVLMVAGIPAAGPRLWSFCPFLVGGFGPGSFRFWAWVGSCTAPICGRHDRGCIGCANDGHKLSMPLNASCEVRVVEKEIGGALPLPYVPYMPAISSVEGKRRFGDLPSATTKCSWCLISRS